MTPPFGFNLFYLKAALPVTMSDIYLSDPYVLVTFIGVFIVYPRSRSSSPTSSSARRNSALRQLSG